ncbi:MAG: pyridoxamine 5'-phosphate oxidase family protein [Pseudomonadales bacterium]|nr:pyridoxamine 5'-phosphate oxidase family protein [Pseudomonadales bacterium]
MSTARYPRTERTRLKRAPGRANYDADAVHAALDAGLLCHIGYVVDGKPYVTPTAYWREDDHVYWHSATAGRMARHQAAGADVAFTVSHFDALVMARSAFHHSVNYRSVMAFGRCEEIRDPEERMRQLERFIERIAPGRWQQIRPPNPRELRKTSVLRLKLEEVVLKSRSGPVNDDAEDMAIPVWAGLLPVETRIGKPASDPQLAEGIRAPKGLRSLQTN